MTVGVFVIVAPVTAGVVAGVDAVGSAEATGDVEGQTGFTSSNPVCTPLDRMPPSTGTGVASVHAGSADAGCRAMIGTSTNDASTDPMSARFMCPRVPASPEIIHAPVGA
ncbi:MAG: hypothetical protein ACXVQS_12340, partial [Actinomycetota bacterium]